MAVSTVNTYTCIITNRSGYYFRKFFTSSKPTGKIIHFVEKTSCSSFTWDLLGLLFPDLSTSNSVPEVRLHLNIEEATVVDLRSNQIHIQQMYIIRMTAFLLCLPVRVYICACVEA